MWATLLVILLLPLLSASFFGIKEDILRQQQVTYLLPDEPHVQDGQDLTQMLYAQNRMHVFCKKATRPTMWNVFQSSRLRLQISADGDYKQYKAKTMEEVYLAHHHLAEDFEGKPLGWGGTSEHRIISLSGHKDACYGIFTASEFALTLEVNSFDLERVAQFSFGIVLWISCPLLADSLLWVHCSAAALGAHLAAVAVVFGAVLASGEERSFGRLFPLKANFKQVYEERPTSVILMLLVGAWILQAGSKKVSFLWQYRIIRCLHFRLLRGVAYYLILSASDHSVFGWACVFMLLTWPNISQLPQFLKTLYNSKGTKLLLRARRVKTPCMPQRSQEQAPHHCHRRGGILKNRDGDECSPCENFRFNKRHLRTPLEELYQEDCGEEAMPSTEPTEVVEETWNTMSNHRRAAPLRSTSHLEPNLSPIHGISNYEDSDDEDYD